MFIDCFGEDTLYVPGIPADCIDATGAGDAFFAGFMYGIMKDEPIEKCALYGNITGGKCVTAVGCTTAYFTEDELLAMAEKYKDNIIYNY